MPLRRWRRAARGQQHGRLVHYVLRTDTARTKVQEGKDIINQSGLNVIAADDLDDAAQKIVKAV